MRKVCTILLSLTALTAQSQSLPLANPDAFRPIPVVARLVATSKKNGPGIKFSSGEPIEFSLHIRNTSSEIVYGSRNPGCNESIFKIQNTEKIDVHGLLSDDADCGQSKAQIILEPDEYRIVRITWNQYLADQLVSPGQYQIVADWLWVTQRNPGYGYRRYLPSSTLIIEIE